MCRWREVWKTKEKYDLAIAASKKWHASRPEFVGPRQWKKGDIHPDTGLQFAQYNNKGWSQVWVTKEKFEQTKITVRTKAREKRRSDPQKYRDRDNAWNAKNPGVRAAQLRRKRAEDPKYKEADKKWRRSNPDRVRAITRRWWRRASKDPIRRIRRALGSRVWDILFRRGLKKRASTLKSLGCSVGELRKHIESQFSEGMTWENYGAYRKSGPRSWCIEHITPCALARTVEEVEALFHYTNLRPFWSKENGEKSDFLPCGRRAREVKSVNGAPAQVGPQ